MEEFDGVPSAHLTLINQQPAIHYKREDDTFTKKPSWSDAEKLIAQYMMGTRDAAILNMFECSAIPYFLTKDDDFDLPFNTRKPQGKILLKI